MLLLGRRLMASYLMGRLAHSTVGRDGAGPERSAVVRGRDSESAQEGLASTMLAADEDRSTAELVLRENFAQGRLSLVELTARVAQVQDARTIGHLRASLRELPGDPWACPVVSEGVEDQAHTALVLALIAVLVPVPPLALGVTSTVLAVRSLRAGVAVRRGQALAAAAIGSAVALIQIVVLVLVLAGAI